MQVNDLIFKELLKRGYSLEGRTRIWNIADSKLWYLTPEQAQGFLDLEKSKEYQKDVIQKEIDLIKDNINEILKKLDKKPVNIIDLGCGDGKKAVLFINHLKGKVKLRYCPIDISGYMVEKAVEKIKKMNVGEVVEFQWNISDFENLENVSQILRMGNYKNNLFLLLGNTLGNFEINELLYSIKSSMKEGDSLLIGNGLDNRNHEAIIKSYGTKEIENWLSQILTQVGLERSEIDFSVKFNHSRVELFFIMKKDKKVSFQDKHIYFAKGDQILVSVSYKYDEADFKKFMKIYFDDVRVFTSKDKSYTLAICKK
ncbi:MAG: L-histidine N(alpha)-methyltransferase [archaeon]